MNVAATIKPSRFAKDSVELVTTLEAAKILKISAVRVNQLIGQYLATKGEHGLRAEKMNSRFYLVYKSSVEDYKKNRRPAGRPREKEVAKRRRRAG